MNKQDDLHLDDAAAMVRRAFADIRSQVEQIPDARDRCEGLRLLVICMSGKNAPDESSALGLLLLKHKTVSALDAPWPDEIDVDAFDRVSEA